LLGTGIGLAYAALINLIVQAVPRDQTGVATGINTIARTVGGAFGTQIVASVLAGGIAANGLASEGSFTIAFVISAIALLGATVAAFAVPKPPRASQVDVVRERVGVAAGAS
jgi:MFS family permease